MSCEIFISGPPTQYTCEPHDVTFEPQDEGYPETCPRLDLCSECGGILPAKPLDPGCTSNCQHKAPIGCHATFDKLKCAEESERRWISVGLLSVRALGA